MAKDHIDPQPTERPDRMNRIISNEDILHLTDDELLGLWESMEIDFHSLPYGSWERCAAYASLESISAALATRRHMRRRYAQVTR